MSSEQKKKDLTEQQLDALAANIAEFSAFRTALTRESDRGCALFAAAYLDKSLGDLLKACMVQGRKMEEELFTGQAPLSTFSSRIKLAYYLGKIAPSERKDLDTIRSIRNEFAHHAELLSFDDQSIRDRCNNLTHNWREKGAPARTKFTAAIAALLVRISSEKFNSIAANEANEAPLPEHIKQNALAFRAALSKAMSESSNSAKETDQRESKP